MLANIFGGLLFCILGSVLAYYAHWIVKVFGRISWAELHLGGTKNLLILVGFGIVLIGIAMMFGIFRMTDPAGQISTGFVM